jgi:2-oxo-4-hydroxy-4-carboxy-5-ureidoimidazoline decarboxylase
MGEIVAGIALEELNELPADPVRQALGRCCSAGRWIDAVAAARPYDSLESLLAQSDAAVAALSECDLEEALEGHPRIGERRTAGWSAQEQAGVAAADAELSQALADGNAAYEERFGHIYLVCATGRTGTALLALLRERLGNEADEEWRVVAAELAKINRIRLQKLVGAG